MQEILFPVGRLVGGSLYQSRVVTDTVTKQPKLNADGSKVISFSFGVAFPKTGTTHWAQTEWGAKIWAEGHQAWPNGQAGSNTFAWKMIDGDSQIPNKAGRKPAENEGWPGHWVVWFSGSYAPKTCNANGTVVYTDGVEHIKPGHFVQVFGSVKGNNPSPSPGVYLNFAMVAHSGFGPEIQLANAIDATTVGFGNAPLPAGASAAPLGQMTPAQATANAGAPAVPGVALGGPPVPMAAPATPSAVPVVPTPPIVPDTAFMQPPAPVVHTMTAKAAGAPYEAFISKGWTDDMLRAQGYMV